MYRSRVHDPSTASRPQRWLKRLLLTATATFVTLLVAEVGLRIAAVWLHKQRGIVFHEEWGWRMVPGVEKTGFMWGGSALTRINGQGWRDAEFDLEPTPGKARLAVIGDSFTFGVGLNYGHRFSEMLEASDPKLEVMNFGINASGTDQQLRIVEEAVLAYRPRVIMLVTFLGNDLEDIRYEVKGAWPKPHYEFAAGELRLVRPVPTLGLRLRTTLHLGELLFRALEGTWDTSTKAKVWETADTVPLYLALVERMRLVVTGAGSKLLVALVYGRNGSATGRQDAEHRVLAGLAQRRIPTLDTFDAFKTAETLVVDAAGLHLPDGHWNRNGNARFADLVRKRIAELGWLKP